MDEITIDEKKYISSKRAAKITGYAKDYVGQLCREGRVPARLIGRNWYVLESAIQDHRFGDSEIQSEETVLEAPRYETAPEEIFPSVNRLRTEELSEEPLEEDQKEEDPSTPSQEDVQDPWGTWFKRFEHTGSTDTFESRDTEKTKEEPEIEVVSKPEVRKEEDATVNIPIRPISKTIPAEFLPRYSELKLFSTDTAQEQQEPTHRRAHKKNHSVVLRTFQVCGILLAIASATIAALGTGYFDSYVLSSSPASLIAGVALYNK